MNEEKAEHTHRLISSLRSSNCLQKLKGMHREKNLENKKALTQASINNNISMLQIVEKL